MKRLVSGIQPTGELTLGNYIGALKQFINLQDEYETYLFIADLHAITIQQDKELLKKRIKDRLALYLACGLDHQKVIIFLQSENPYHAQLSWLLSCHTYLGELKRMTQFKDKAKKQKKDTVTGGLFTYPILMASDILLYDANIVPVGEDQKQHLELTRDLAIRFNNRYGKTFKIPEPIIPKIGAKIKNLQNPKEKMSKSDPLDKGNIFLLDSPDIIKDKIKRAVTDSDCKINYDVLNKPGLSNLITIYAALSNMSIKEVVQKYQQANYGEFKNEVANIIIETLKPIQEKYKTIINSNLIDEILDEGIKKVTPLAMKKCLTVQQKIGLSR